MRPLEKKSFLTIRRQLIGKAHGEVLEIGCGTGVNFSFYRQVKVTAIEPNEVLREAALRRSAQAQAPIHVMEGNAEALPFKDNSFDTVVATLVFCTIPDPQKAIREIMRVCKPGGRLLFFEHIRHEQSWAASLQDLLTPVWKRVFDGCHLNRDTEALLKREGIQITELKSYFKKLFITVEAENAPKTSK